MRIRKARQLLKSFADDTRLRIINLLNCKQLTVSELCDILEKNQSNLSKHLSRLRLTGIVLDKRKGLSVYYSLIRSEEKAHKELLNVITEGLCELEIFKKDLQRLQQIIKIKKKGGGVMGGKKKPTPKPKDKK